MTERDGGMRVAAGVARSREDIALSRDPRRLVPVVSREALLRLQESLVRADREIALALEYASKPHTEAEHAGALLGELDWRSERTRLLDELARRLNPAVEQKVDVGGFGY